MFEATHMYLWFMKQIVTKEELRKVESRSGKGIVQFGWLNLNFVCKWGPCTSHTDVLQHYVQWQQLCLTMQYLESPPFLWGINWSSFVPARHLLTLGQWIVFRMKFLRYLLAFFVMDLSQMCKENQLMWWVIYPAIVPQQMWKAQTRQRLIQPLQSWQRIQRPPYHLRSPSVPWPWYHNA